MSKKCAKWVPYKLSPNQKKESVSVFKQLLKVLDKKLAEKSFDSIKNLAWSVQAIVNLIPKEEYQKSFQS
ncbi:24186_t:CDS:2 [Racocetra persica]|uniref:24186_t:CDS:1 n=1 Tax=Racocetra persica TaxID=160502 RepID=A0ACA9KFY7_9GLOM|nr:24186_t:CDS:2 [Racocetra persica]